LFRKRAADLAKPNSLPRAEDGLGQAPAGVSISLHQMQGDSLSGSRADAGQFAQLSDERGNGVRQSRYLFVKRET